MASDQSSPLNMFIPLVLVWLVFYFLVFRPQSQKQKELKEMLKNLKKNDEVITTGGIHGTIVNIKDTTVVIRVDEHARIEIERDAVMTVKKSDNEIKKIA